MIEEFAIDPRTMAEWKHFQALWDDFGFDKGRLIAEFPAKKWRQTVYEEASKRSRPREASAIVARISAEYKSKMLRGARPFAFELADWYQAALQAHHERRFCVIMSGAAPTGAEDTALIHPDRVNRGVEPYAVRVQRRLDRKGEAVAEAYQLVLSRTRRVQLFDPYFRPDGGKWTRFAEQLLKRTNTKKLQSVVINVLVDESKRLHFNRENEERALRTYLRPIVPEGATLTLKFWRQKVPVGAEFHARCLICDDGGITVDPGFDEGPAGHRIRVTLMDKMAIEEVRSDFGENPVYDLEEGGMIAL